jgi:hypothetical protein
MGNTYSAYSNIVNGTTFDSYAVALINRMIAAGETPSAGQKTAINTCIVQLRAASFFETQFDALVITRGHGAQSTKMNWISNNYNASGVNNPVFTDNAGYNTTGTQYINTNFNPTSVGGLYTQNNASWGYKSSGNLGSGTKLHGTYPDVYAYRGVFGAAAFNAAVDTPLTSAATGYNCLSRALSNKWFVYINSSSVEVSVAGGASAGASNSTGRPNQNFYQLALNNAGTAASFSTSTEILEAYWFGESMTQAQFLSFQTILNTYFASI